MGFQPLGRRYTGKEGDHVYDLYSLDFSILSPCGARDRKRLVQVDSLLSLMEKACGEPGGS